MLFLFSIYLVVISSHFPDYFHTHMTLFHFFLSFSSLHEKKMSHNHFLAFRLSNFRCLIPFFWSCIRADLLCPLLPPVNISLSGYKVHILHSYFFCRNSQFSSGVVLQTSPLSFSRFCSIWNKTVNISLLLAFLESSFDSFSSRELDRSLLSFSFHLVSLLVHSFKNALPRLLQKLFRRSGFPLAERSLKFLLQLFLFLFYVIFQSEIFTGWKMLLLLCLLPFSW